jgi:hypothetical protein
MAISYERGMAISKILEWVSAGAAIAGIAWIAFAITRWTLADPKLDPLIEAVDLFFGPVCWLLIGAAASFVASKIFKWAGE